MTRKRRTPEENACREKFRELLQMANIGSITTLLNKLVSLQAECGLYLPFLDRSDLCNNICFSSAFSPSSLVYKGITNFLNVQKIRL